MNSFWQVIEVFSVRKSVLGGFYFFKKKKIQYLSELMHIKIIGLQFKAKGMFSRGSPTN